MLLVVGGMIGLGKTTLAEILADEFKGKVYYEQVDDNPILPLYYTATAEEIKANRYPFLLQLFFLNSRFETLKQAALNSVTNASIIDRSIYEDWYFAKINYELGRMSDLEFSIYKKLLDNMMEEIDSLPKKAPDLMVYLDGSFYTVIDRIKRRGREYELEEDLVDYYKLLHSGYGDWLKNFYNASEVLVINTDLYNIVDNPLDKQKVINLIKEKLNEINKK
ncbi:deoxynucleoside kinase [Haploplasma modicum]|uniref:deoxynucleoside kinase n=1 Tax=Haploplasma modicum TaxID=2150 RepID=UPI00214ACFC2|nr:deoxynucleoside kinase [Haploplasma modicum]MCR1809469.1 deoxynucleoside kinase [Haploplasma modicum]